ncbi:hypothetical protein KY495_03060 [Massilia sp. PAMC28688]|uniref:hypothetical protein n=1 Tax=Massilia sp. PAMC28688 TaxID=2861283 RepID=UPI001C639ACE|nr:hypothetical protein [Massilia sp. PAMC28688]QYF94220.1 hypothetical protein KY495_03060 [Massilia sp. PAMC28688]
MPDRLAGICWPHAATVGHATVTTPFIYGSFSRGHGNDGIATCDLVGAGKYRNGAGRWWCRTHQHYWGTKADLAALAATAVKRCVRHSAPMHYVRDPLIVAPGPHARISIAACGQALRVQVDDEPPSVQHAIAIAYDPASKLFDAQDIVQVNVTPPMVAALATPQPQGCVCCSRCGHPHLDLGDFAARPHRRHYCGHCGNDTTHSKTAIVSTPLLPLIAYYRGALNIPCSIVPSNNML